VDLSYQLTREEFVHMSVHESGRSKGRRSRGVFFALYLAFVAFFGVYLLSESMVAAGMAAVFSATAGRLFIRFLHRLAVGRIYDMTRTGRNIDLRMDAGGLFISRPHLRSELDWEGITALTEDNVGFYITYGPLQSVYVPRRAFESAAAAQEFWATANEYWQYARPAAQNVPVRIR
jgi:hypothetical protein